MFYIYDEFCIRPSFICHMVLNSDSVFIQLGYITFLDIPNGKDMVNSLFVQEYWCHSFNMLQKQKDFFFPFLYNNEQFVCQVL